MNQAAIQLGTLAEGRADLADVETFALQEIQDHKVAQAGLTEAVGNASNETSGGVFLPSNTKISATDAATSAQLTPLRGSAFDQSYMAAMVAFHQDAVNRFRAASASNSSAVVRNYASGYLPTLSAHLRMAQELAMRVGAPPATSTSTGSGTGTGSGSSGNNGVSSTSDNDFISFAAGMNQAEIQIGQLAESRADLPDVKAYGLQLIEDHKAAQDALRAAAAGAGNDSGGSTVFPSTVNISATDQALITQLTPLSGSGFDPAFISAMITDHMAAIARFRAQSTAGNSSAFVRNYASGFLPTLTRHLQLAQDLATRIGVPTTGATATH